jgi:hypothetical protein
MSDVQNGSHGFPPAWIAGITPRGKWEDALREAFRLYPILAVARPVAIDESSQWLMRLSTSLDREYESEG